MNKQNLIDAVAEKSGMSKVDVKKSLDAFFDVVKENVAKEKIVLIGFGSFSVSERGERVGRNPQTGKEIKIAAKKVVKFKAGAEFDKPIN